MTHLMKMVHNKQASPTTRPPRPEEQSGEIMAPAAVIAYLSGSTVPTIHDLARRGVIPTAIREGRVIRFRIPDVLAALEMRAKEGGTDAR